MAAHHAQLFHEGRQALERADFEVQATSSEIEAYKPRLPAGALRRGRVFAIGVRCHAIEERRHPTTEPCGLLVARESAPPYLALRLRATRVVIGR